VAEIITGNYRLLKDLNSNVILNLVRTNAPVSGAELAKITGMRPSTVHNILKNLEKEKMVLKMGTGSSTKAGGRRPTLWKIRGNYGYVIGLQIELNEIEVVLVNINSRIIDDQHLIIDRFRSLSDIESKIVEVIDNILAANRIEKKRLLGIGVGASGLVDIANGTILVTSLLPEPQLPIYLQKSLSRFYDVPIYIENDANAAVLAEKWFGKINGVGNIIYSLIVVSGNGFGVGFGLVLNNEIYRGANMFAGETELFTLNIEKILKEYCDFCGDGIEIDGKSVALKDIQLQHLLCALKDKNKEAIRFFKEVGNIVGMELIKVINMLDPQLIVIGGEILRSKEYILEPIKNTIENRYSSTVSRKTQIIGSSLSQYSVALGAATIILKKIFQDAVVDNARLPHVI